MTLEDRMHDATRKHISATKKETEIWRDYRHSASALCREVEKEFKKTVSQVLPEEIRVTSVSVVYNPISLDFGIKIDKLETPEGHIGKDSFSNICPHMYLKKVTWYGAIDSKIKEFQARYHVSHIENPENNCEHK